jgi:hypothetical protein
MRGSSGKIREMPLGDGTGCQLIGELWVKLSGERGWTGEREVVLRKWS